MNAHTTARYITINLLQTSDEEQNLKVSGKEYLTCRRRNISMTADMSSGKNTSEKTQNNNFKILTSNPISSKYVISNKGKGGDICMVLAD